MKKALSIYTICCDVLEKIVNTLLVIVMGGLVISISLQVFSRMAKNSLLWTEDMGIILMAWLTFLGITICFRKKEIFTVHIWPDNWRIITILLNILTVLMVLSLSIFFLFEGFDYVLNTSGGTTGMARIPKPVLYVSLPLTSIIMILFSLEQAIYTFIRGSD